MATWLGRITTFIGAAALLLAVGGCDPGDEGPELKKASFSSWEVITAVTSGGTFSYIAFFDIGTPTHGKIYRARYVPTRGMSVEVLSSLQSGTAALSGRGSWCDPNRCYFRQATIFVSSQAEADAWNRYFAELVVQREKEMGEKWSPKKIQPPPTLQKND